MRIHPRFTHRIAVAILSAATILTLLILIFIIGFIFEKGLPVLSLKFLTSSPQDMGKAGGIFPTLIGTIILPLLAIIIATPLGICTSVYLCEYTKETIGTKIIRFGTDC